MATPNVWISTDGVWNSVSSWRLGHTPTNTEAAMLDGSVQTDVKTAMDTAAPLEIVVTEDHFGSIGGPGNYLDVGASATKITIRGNGGRFFIQPRSAGHIVQNSDNSYLELTGNTIPSVFIVAGECRLTGTYAVAGWNIGTFGENALLTLDKVESPADYPKHIICSNGRIVSKLRSDPINAQVYSQRGGIIRHEGIIASVTQIVNQSGRFVYVPDGDPASDNPFIFVDGVFDARESQFTIVPGTMLIGPNGQILGSVGVPGLSLPDIDLREEYP